MSSNEIKPTNSELEILQVIWKIGPASVRKVNDILNMEREVGYTTTLKIMQLMNSKGILGRTSEGKKHIYSSNVKEKDIQRGLVKRMINKTFKGSAYNLVMEALGNNRASAEELKSIKELIEKMEGGQNE